MSRANAKPNKAPRHSVPHLITENENYRPQLALADAAGRPTPLQGVAQRKRNRPLQAPTCNGRLPAASARAQIEVCKRRFRLLLPSESKSLKSWKIYLSHLVARRQFLRGVKLPRHSAHPVAGLRPAPPAKAPVQVDSPTTTLHKCLLSQAATCDKPSHENEIFHYQPPGFKRACKPLMLKVGRPHHLNDERCVAVPILCQYSANLCQWLAVPYRLGSIEISPLTI